MLEARINFKIMTVSLQRREKKPKYALTLYTPHKIYTKSETYSTAKWQAIIQFVMDTRI